MWFKKNKKVEEKPDFSSYKFFINGKVMCAYEAMTGKPYLKISTEEEVAKLFYCSLVISNPEFRTMTFDVFLLLLNDEEVTKWMVGEFEKITEYASQFRISDGKEDGEEEKDPKPFFMSEAISGLIVRMGLDPHYVMYEMDEWEISRYYDMMQQMDRDRMTEDRFWTYLQIVPHVTKNLGGPEKFLPFPWEKEDKAKKDDKGLAAATAFFKIKEEDNGEGRHDDSPEQG